MKQTMNYALKKPEPMIDNVDVEIINGNMDKIDVEITKKADKTVASQTKDGLMNSADKEKLDNISDGAEVNVQSDWNVTDNTSDAFIKNKPTSFPASGGNADTLDGKHATDFIAYMGTDTISVTDRNRADFPYSYETDISDGTTIGLPASYYHLKYQKHGNYAGGYATQTAIKFYGESTMYIRTANGLVWGAWHKLYDDTTIVKSTSVPTSLADGSIWLMYE